MSVSFFGTELQHLKGIILLLHLCNTISTIVEVHILATFKSMEATAADVGLRSVLPASFVGSLYASLLSFGFLQLPNALLGIVFRWSRRKLLNKEAESWFDLLVLVPAVKCAVAFLRLAYDYDYAAIVLQHPGGDINTYAFPLCIVTFLLLDVVCLVPLSCGMLDDSLWSEYERSMQQTKRGTDAQLRAVDIGRSEASGSDANALDAASSHVNAVPSDFARHQAFLQSVEAEWLWDVDTDSIFANTWTVLMIALLFASVLLGLRDKMASEDTLHNSPTFLLARVSSIVLPSVPWIAVLIIWCVIQLHQACGRSEG